MSYLGSPFKTRKKHTMCKLSASLGVCVHQCNRKLTSANGYGSAGIFYIIASNCHLPPKTPTAWHGLRVQWNGRRGQTCVFSASVKDNETPWRDSSHWICPMFISQGKIYTRIKGAHGVWILQPNALVTNKNIRSMIISERSFQFLRAGKAVCCCWYKTTALPVISAVVRKNVMRFDRVQLHGICLLPHCLYSFGRFDR